MLLLDSSIRKVSCGERRRRMAEILWFVVRGRCGWGLRKVYSDNAAFDSNEKCRDDWALGYILII